MPFAMYWKPPPLVMHLSAPFKNRNDMQHCAEETAEEVSTDEVAIIFSFLPPHDDIMRLRRVCTTWRDAAKKTLVPLTEFVVNSVRSYNAMRAMSTALPNLQQLSLHYLCQGHKYSDGEDPYEWAREETSNYIAHGIDIISRFSKLCSLDIDSAPLNGRYPALFNFPLLQKLSISDCTYLKWDLNVLEGLPLLKELCCENNPRVTGSLSSLRVLKDTLEKVTVIYCRRVEGNFMDLADFPRLKELNLTGPKVRGDIREIGEHDFPFLEDLSLPKSVYGGIRYELQLISDVPGFVQAIHHLLQRSPTIFNRDDALSEAFHWSLSEASPDWYGWDDESECPPPPFDVQFIQAGSRLGWSWCDTEDEVHSCEINWLDPEPDRESEEYERYMEQLSNIKQRIKFFRGYNQPPTEEEYRQLCEEYNDDLLAD